MEVGELSKAIEKAGLELVIGLETHVRLNTASKLFCACPNEESEQPNTHICPVCTGQMGALPVVNKAAVYKAIAFGKAVGSSFSNPQITWDRKHYEYPDNPKNIQITQFENPVVPDGEVSCFRDDGTVFKVSLEQAHLEEDAAKLIHEKKYSLVDFNKAGVPLIEIVTKPCIRKIKDAATYAQYIQRIVQNIGISEANLEKGEFKSDVSVSLRKKGTDDLNPRTEIKNLNSFKFMIDALCEEVTKQFAYYQEHNSFRPDQTTVLWDENLKQTKTMRKKEYAADYRFIREPDLPRVAIEQAVETVQIQEAALPFVIESEMINGGVLPQDAKFFTANAKRSEVFTMVNKQVQNPLFVAKALTNNIAVDAYDLIDDTETLAQMIKLYQEEKINAVVFQKGIEQFLSVKDFQLQGFVSANTVDLEQIKQVVMRVIEQNSKVAQDIAQGNLGKAGVLVGKVLKVVGKAASGKIIRQLVLDALQSDGESQSQIAKDSEKQSSNKNQQNDDELPQVPLVVKEVYKSHLIKELSEGLLEKEVTLAGWVSSVRDHGELVFVDLRDASYEVMQLRLSRESLANFDSLIKIKPESVIHVVGKIKQRGKDDFNPGLRTGTIELETTSFDILNLSKTLPFEIKRAAKSSEQVRFQYKFLDHRNEGVRKAIVNRHKVIKLIRDILDENNFIEVETPILTAGTDEGAREFIVPSRKHQASFYTLPQAPQQFKQMLMVGGFEKYFQIARCFRDEDSRGDRQPEFTQLDMELAYVSMQDVIDLNTALFQTIVKKVYGNKWDLHPFQVLTYKEAMDKYGCDRPDLRFGLEMQDITDIVKETTFQVFVKPIEEGGIVKCIKVDKASQGKKRLSKGQIEKLTTVAQENGLGGLAYIIVNKDELQSPIIKYLGEQVAANIIAATEATEGDIVFFSASDYATANKALDAVRQALGAMLKLINPKVLKPAWVVDFPMFEKTDEGRWTFTHNPFSMPAVYDIDKHMNGRESEIGSIIAQQYDLILNGYEIGGGSVRAHKPEILEATYKNMGYNKEEMLKSVGTMYKAFHYGAPPHGGIAWGIDRLMMILEKKASIREVMAFPKTGSSEDLLFNSPSVLSDKKVEEMNVKVIKK